MPLASITAHWLDGWGQESEPSSGSVAVLDRRPARRPTPQLERGEKEDIALFELGLID